MRWLPVLLLTVLPVLPVQAQQQATSANGGMLRLLDKISGDTTDMRIGRGQTKLVGRLAITLGDCRYPSKDPNSDAFGWLEIRDDTMDEPAFSGWMFASSPALNAMDHPRYDVWLLRCNNE